ncbi:hypothetical protein [Sandaracinus amylolyticus]|uniref:hypothetical protein n=1 Tax=Sandaracinus amylolyticus TaxID=927083 RepID=UPI001F3C77DC|nr:hypothetical protein [Sandaracinus amylolyticus]UJR83543.1 Hypothetical protein I5071_56110 [Sandaracinus amylolyticus]
MRVTKLSGVLAGVTVLAVGLTVSAQRGGTGGTTGTQQPGTTAQPQTGTTPQRGAAGGGTAEQMRNEVCPVGIRDMQVQTTNLEEGGTLVFTTSAANVTQLRDRLNRLVQMHQQQMGQQQQQMGATGGTATQRGTTGTTGQMAQQQPPQQPGATGGTGMQQQRRFADPQALIHQGQIEMVEIPNGAVLLIQLPDQQRVSDLRNELREDARALQQGRCPLSLQVESA